MSRYNEPEGWYNARRGNPRMDNSDFYSTTRESVNRKEIFRLSAFRPPSVIFCILGAASISLAITNLVVTRQAYFNDPATNKATMVWYNCSQTGESLIAPNNMLRSNALWFFEAIVLVFGLWVFLLGIWSGFAASLNIPWLKALIIFLRITFLGVLLKAIFSALDLISSFSCLNPNEMDLNDNIKVSMPFFLIILAAVQLLVTGFLYSLATRLLKFRQSKHSSFDRMPRNDDEFNDRMRVAPKFFGNYPGSYPGGFPQQGAGFSQGRFYGQPDF